jgi:signal-transduction protein with cAMP-binding, CBS, and nucleotidyltransferase domain
MATKKITGKKKSTGMKRVEESRSMRVKDLVITDEFKTIQTTASGRDAAEILMAIPRGVVLVCNPENKVEGVITAREFLKQIVDGENPTELTAAKLMNTDIMEIKYHALLDTVVPKITERDPYAVVVTDKDGNFKGYFSPKDYQEALARINYMRTKTK